MSRRLLAAGLAAALLGGTIPAAAGWDRFEIILWHDHGPAALAGAQRLGVTAGLAFGVRDDAATGPADELARRTAPLRAAGLGFYVENIATDFYAAYHRWRPDHPVTWLFDLAQARHAADPADPSVFIRTPGLSDPAAQDAIRRRLAAHVHALGAAPLYYNLADEAGIADLTAAWDFDVSETSLAGLRGWLREQYGTLGALNAEWGSDFATWEQVRPLSTDAALRVQDGNFAAWCDFKAWMDIAFARAVRAGTEAIHAANPAARSGLEGGQAPGWGGYDYTVLAHAVDVMELGGSESSQAIALAMNPALITLTTLGGDGAADAQRLWLAALQGYRGAVLWDPEAEVVRPDGTPGPRGQALAPVLADLAGPAGQALLAARPHADKVAILYSPASFRLRWILDRQRDAAAGQDWSRRRSETELEDNALRAATRNAVAALSGLFLQPRFLSPAMLEGGALMREGMRVLILPQGLALSDAGIAAVRGFAAAGGVVLADAPPGDYDAHGRARPAPPLGDVAQVLPGLDPAALAQRLRDAGMTADFALHRPDGTEASGAAVYTLDTANTRLLGVLDSSGLKLQLDLTHPARWRNLRAPAGSPASGWQTGTRITLPPASGPALLELAD